jgi:hypothetical protein|tara:strand:- start:736 stop:1572 length:837 start_codon:yes stop_codon:yes gene_type:complete
MQKVKIFMFTTATNPARVVSQNWLNCSGLDYTTIVSKPEQVELAEALNCANVTCCDVSSTPWMRRLLTVRKRVLQQKVNKGEWALFVNDNILNFNLLRSDLDKQDFKTRTSTEWREAYREPVKPQRVSYLLHALQQKCIETGATYGGFGDASGNYYFSPSRWSLGSYVIGDVCLTRKTEEFWVPAGYTIFDDWYNTCLSLANTGSVVSLRYASKTKLVTSNGGIGTEAQRTPHKIEDAKLLIKRFPGLIGYHQDREDCLQLKKRKRQLELWRKENQYL